MKIQVLDFEIGLPDGLKHQKKEATPERLIFTSEDDGTPLRAEVYQTRQNIASLPEKEEYIAGIRTRLGEDQGLVEAERCRTAAGNPLVYRMIKTVKELGGVTYALTVLCEFRQGIFLLVACFTEKGVTGVRDTAVLASAMQSGAVGPGLEGWMRDPYDPDYTKGICRNLSEDPQYDRLFPHHPLSEARAFLAAFCREN